MNPKLTIAPLLLVLLFTLSVRCDDEVAAKVGHQWRRGFIGKFSITPESDIEEGWRLTVTFAAPIRRLEVWQANIESKNKDKTEFVLVNQAWNSQLKAGIKYEFNFKGSKKRGPVPEITVALERLGEGSGNSL